MWMRQSRIGSSMRLSGFRMSPAARLLRRTAVLGTMGACINVRMPSSSRLKNSSRAGEMLTPPVVTGILMVQGALTILEDDIKLDGGVYTPACLGQSFIDRLDRAGFHFKTDTVPL